MRGLGIIPIAIGYTAVWVGGIILAGFALVGLGVYLANAAAETHKDFEDLAKINPELEAFAQTLSPDQQQQFKQLTEDTYTQGYDDGKTNSKGLIGDTSDLLKWGAIGFIVWKAWPHHLEKALNSKQK